ncbi:uncharacterized protein At3g49140 isoform X2 [Eucalyptus grandis]|uniref:Uncharacterized protein n=4 Tax=Eucalyptus grandis TaxID=71139 RepID=A0ACC3JKW9_EUCGR|nr:uncharacterized protein At3g49140 isoform X2 [Eucalyptus grandis]KAK3414564.1 hypothetical protein EUGRSUZ_H00428 [Eucalyptus grandis]
MSIAAASSLTFGSSRYNLCHSECSTSCGIAGMGSWMKHSLDGRRAVDFPSMRSLPFQWLPIGNELCLSRVSVAADYSDSLPDSSNYTSDQGYHPLEEVKPCKRTRETKLTSAEIARTTVEACSNALLVFPGPVHREPHEQISWAEFQYVVDDYGDIFFEIFDDENILEDRGATSPVNVFIGMDIPVYDNKKMADEYDMSDIGMTEISYEDDYLEVMETEVFDNAVDWGMPDPSILVHPVYFAKCLTKAVNAEYDKKMDTPSNGLSILGCLRPAFSDEESYLRKLFQSEDADNHNLDWKDADVVTLASSDRKGCNSIIYRLEIIRIELFSVYGSQCEIHLQDFLDAEPDILVHSTSAILDRFSEKGIRCNVALKALCKRKGLHVEGANIIGVDSLGMDVRIYSGTEVRTHRFPFKIQATSEAAAEKQIQQLLFPRSRRKKLRTHGDGYRNPDPY